MTFHFSGRSAGTKWSLVPSRVLKIIKRKLSASCLIESFGFIKRVQDKEIEYSNLRYNQVKVTILFT